MATALPGIHHVTAIAGDPQQNVDFYAGLLGLRLVKITINYDDPGSYHFYYGDGTGSPGTILTFFAWPGGRRGQRGTGQATVASFAVPAGAIEYWKERFKAHDLSFEPSAPRFGEKAITFFDPDGLQLELVEEPGSEARSAWSGSSAPSEQAIRGFFGVTLSEESYEPTARLLTQTRGFQPGSTEEGRRRYEASGGATGHRIDLVSAPGTSQGRGAVGTIHHVAFRALNDADQKAWHERITALGYGISPVMDRQYFHSIYFREPGGVLFEIATDPPGFTTDETVEQLGTGLKLPTWLEAQRPQIEQALPRLRLPQTEVK